MTKPLPFKHCQVLVSYDWLEAQSVLDVLTVVEKDELLPRPVSSKEVGLGFPWLAGSDEHAAFGLLFEFSPFVKEGAVRVFAGIIKEKLAGKPNLEVWVASFQADKL